MSGQGFSGINMNAQQRGLHPDAVVWMSPKTPCAGTFVLDESDGHRGTTGRKEQCLSPGSGLGLMELHQLYNNSGCYKARPLHVLSLLHTPASSFISLPL